MRFLKISLSAVAISVLTNGNLLIANADDSLLVPASTPIVKIAETTQKTKEVSLNSDKSLTNATTTTVQSTYVVDFQNVNENLKQQIINEFQNSNSNDVNIDNDKTHISLSTYNALSNDAQNVALDGEIIDANDNVVKTLHQTISIQLNIPSSLSSIAKKQTVIVDYGSESFNYMNNVTLIPNDDGTLPVVLESDNINLNEEGTYTCTITSINIKGEVTTTEYQVQVQKNEETLRQEAEAQTQAETEQQVEQERQAAEQLAQQQAEQQAQQQLASISNSATIAAIANSSGASDIVSYARQFIGCSYVYGGNDPATGVDCSGFTKYVYAHFGITLNRVASAQTANGTLVSAEQAQPGDLVIWSGHVGIYSGNGMMINAENPSSGVRESAISYFMSGSSGTFLGYYHVTG